MPTPIVLEEAVSCSSDVCSLWSALADTDRLNRVVGMERLDVQPLEGRGAARFLVRTHLGGFDVSYEEPPFEWEHLRRFCVERHMRSGPVELPRMEFRTETKGLSTVVHLRLTLVPRLRLLGPIVRLSGMRSLGRIARAVTALDGAIQRGELELLGPRSPVDEAALGLAVRELESAGAGDVASRLADQLRREADHAVAILRPYELADRWGLARREVLSGCVLAVRAGLLDLRWDLVCPSCRTGSSSVASLADVGEHASCQLCELSFGLDLDESVEAVFSPAPAVRRVSGGPYCTGGPARTPHVLAQAVLAAERETSLAAPREPGRYRLFVRGGGTLPVEVADGGATELALDASGLGWPTRARVAPGGSLRLSNARAEALHAKVERAEWVRQAATARDLMMLPQLRTGLSGEVLNPGLALKVGRVAILFSDLTGSTELYATAGEAAAFRLVLDHFDLLTRTVESHEGTVVKTIGDAIMAVFPAERQALAAGLDMLSAFETFRRTDPVRAGTHLKIGVYGGPCFAVTANKALDYFGQTVNIAARLQGEAKRGELVAARAVVQEAAARGALGVASVVERYAAVLKGVPAPIEVARVTLDAVEPSGRRSGLRVVAG